VHLKLLSLYFLLPDLIVKLHEVKGLLHKTSDVRVLVIEQFKDHIDDLSLFQHDVSSHSEE
jgi:hypothetical protein